MQYLTLSFLSLFSSTALLRFAAELIIFFRCVLSTFVALTKEVKISRCSLAELSVKSENTVLSPE